MGKIHLSKSKYCRAVQCNKMLWLDKNMPKESIIVKKCMDPQQ